VIKGEERIEFEFPKVTIGFRLYSTTHYEQGKEDSMGKYFGFGNSCDEDIGSCTIRI